MKNDQQALNTANATLASAESTVQANGSLSGPGLQSSAVQQSAAQEQVALAQAEQVRVQIAKAAIVSPIDGVVVNRNINPGRISRKSRDLYAAAGQSDLRGASRVERADRAHRKRRAGDRHRANDLSGNARFSGHVTGVLNEINPGSTDFQVKVLLANPAPALRPGMVVQGDIATDSDRAAFASRSTAFTDDNHDAVMIVQSDDTIKTVKVTELASDGTTSVIAGIPSGTRIVSNGQTSLGDGEKVSYRQ